MPKLAGRYEVQEHIGQGAMSDVLRAYDPSINRLLAIKVLKAELRQNPQYAARFMREAKAAGALSHPNIVTIYDVGEVEGHPYIVMELLEGEPLDVALQREGQFSARTVMDIGVQLAEALAYAHAAGVVHRDIKPSNIVLGKDGRSVKILDFGIARVTEDSDEAHAETLKTQVGQVLGTPRYMSPEQALGREIDGRSDLFSVGLILYELITGQKAFAGSSAATLALQITQQEPTPLSTLVPDCPRGLQFIVGKLLSKRPDRRFADGGQLADALRRELGHHQSAAADAAGAQRRLPLQVRLTLLMAMITSAVLLVSVGAVLNAQYGAMRRLALTSGSAITSFVASNAALRAVDNAALPPEQRDWLPLEAFVKAAAGDPNVQQMTVVDAQGVIRGSSEPDRVGLAYLPVSGESVIEKRPDLVVTAAQPPGGEPGFRFVRPITYAGHAFGTVDVTVARRELDAAGRLSGLLLFGLCLATLGAVMAVSYVLARLLAAPIRRLKTALSDAALGDLDFRISHNRKDELGELFDSFNRFTAAVQERLEAAEAPQRGVAPRLVGAAAAPAADPDKTQFQAPAASADAATDHTVVRAAG